MYGCSKIFLYQCVTDLDESDPETNRQVGRRCQIQTENRRAKPLLKERGYAHSNALANSSFANSSFAIIALSITAFSIAAFSITGVTLKPTFQ